MIPAWIDDGAPASEKRVFDKLKRDPDTGAWVVLHSLGLARRRIGRYGEIDFVVLVPDEGVICLEVKGGRVSCDENGVWRSRDRHEEVHDIKSPFMQARQSMLALLDAIKKQHGESAAVSQCLMEYAVVFPDVACPPLPLPPAIDRAQIVDCNDLERSIARCLTRCAHYARKTSRNPQRARRPTATDVNAIRKFLRPDFDAVVTTDVKIDRTLEKLVRLTEEQFERLDELEDNERCLFTGPAGTGKTMLAMEYAKRRARAGSRVLLTCFNNLLGAWMRRQFDDASAVTAGNWHDIVKDLALRSSFKDEFLERDRAIHESGAADKNTQGFDELYAYYGALAEKQGAQFDVLVVDEAQDIIGSRHMRGFLDAALRDGLAGGRWTIFGDFNRQALRNNAEPVDASAILADHSRQFTTARLRLNCRNSRPIAEATEIVTGVECRTRRDDTDRVLKVEHSYQPVEEVCSLSPSVQAAWR